MLFLVRNTVRFPESVPPARRAELLQAEREVSHEAQNDGIIAAIWRVSGHLANYILYDVRDNDELHAFIAALPLFDYLEIDVTPLSKHPNSIR